MHKYKHKATRENTLEDVLKRAADIVSRGLSARTVLKGSRINRLVLTCFISKRQKNLDTNIS